MTFEKLLIIGLIAVFVIGPERLPQYAAGLARLVKSLRNMATNARERMREEMGDEFDEINWQDLDPRRYDPRRIIREALLEDPMLPGRTNATAATPSDSATKSASASSSASSSAPKPVTTPEATPAVVENSVTKAAAQARARVESTPFDSEAT